MHVPAESLSATAVRDKVVTAAEAVRLIRDGDSVVVEGFVGQCFAEELTLALEERFLQSGTPRELSLVFTVAQGDRQGRGLDRLCHDGLIKGALGGHWGLAAGLGKLALDNKIEAHNLPQGVIAQLFRDTAAGKPGLLTRVGLGTFVYASSSPSPSIIGRPSARSTRRRSAVSCGGCATRSRRCN
jgi:propionate CoA-transferase